MKNAKGEELLVEDLAHAILSADEEELGLLIEQIQYRYSQLFPQWEICLISIDKGKDRVEQLQNIIAFLEKMK